MSKVCVCVRVRVCVRERERDRQTDGQTELVVVWRVGYETTQGRKDGQGPDIFLLYEV